VAAAVALFSSVSPDVVVWGIRVSGWLLAAVGCTARLIGESTCFRSAGSL